MLAGVKVLWAAIRGIWDDMLLLVLMNLLSVVFTVLIIPGPGAWVALNAMCNRIANGYAISWENYWNAFRANFWRAWKFALPATIITLLIVVNFFWYPSTFGNESWVVWVQGAWLAAGLSWLAINLYVVPFFCEQETKSWRVALRNSALVSGANPIYTVTILVVVVALVIVSLIFVPPVFLFLGLVWWAMVGNAAVADRVKLYRERQDEDAKSKSKRSSSR